MIKPQKKISHLKYSLLRNVVHFKALKIFKVLNISTRRNPVFLKTVRLQKYACVCYYCFFFIHCTQFFMKRESVFLESTQERSDQQILKW